MNRLQFLEQRGQFRQRDLVRPVREGFGGIFVGFNEHPIAARGHCRARQHRGENPVAAGLVSRATGALNGVSCVKHDQVTAFS